MYAHVEQLKIRSGTGSTAAGAATASATTARQDGLVGHFNLQQLGGSAQVRVTLWDTEGNAAAFVGSRELTLPDAEIFEVTATEAGTAARQAPTYARVLHFDGPRAPEQIAAADFAGRQRVWPAMRDLDGMIGMYLLRRRDLGYLVVTFATSVETLDAAGRAVMATDLLPGEDLALLPGPDRMEIHHVTSYQVPVASPASQVGGQ